MKEVKTMKPQLYLWSGIRDNFITDLEQICTIYNTKFEPIFLDIETEAKNIENNTWESMMHSVPYDENVDPSDYAETALETGIEHYEMLYLMKYRTICMWISCLCQIWEQQLYSFVITELQSDGLKPCEKEKGFSFSKDIFSSYGIKFEDLKCWDKIKELRLLVNVIKHAEGRSEEDLRKINKQYFEKPNIMFESDSLKLYHNSLLENNLNVSSKDLEEFKNALVSFWQELPERMYLVK